jgi:hypothetical protein
MIMSNKMSFWRTKSGFSALVLIGIAGYFLFVEHGEHVFPFLPFIFLLMCPLMHLFMHGNHGNHAHKNQHQQSNGESIASDNEQGLNTFAETSHENDIYREGYLEGLKTAREEAKQKENPDGH